MPAPASEAPGIAPVLNWRSAAPGAEGYVAPGFEPVADEFARNFTQRGDLGAAFAVTHEGRPVLDLWGGEVAPGRRWAADSLLGVFSGTKGLLAAVTAQRRANARRTKTIRRRPRPSGPP